MASENPLPIYSAADRTQFRTAFAPVAATYRRNRRIGAYAVVAWVGSFLLPRILPEPASSWLTSWLFLPLILLFVLGIVAAWRSRRLICPGCTQNLEVGLGPYCPECGSGELQPGSFLKPPHCPACDRSLKQKNHRRLYRIRACTHCGLMLDEQGL